MIRESRIKIHRSSALEKNTHYNSSVWNVFKLSTYPILVNRLSKSFNCLLELRKVMQADSTGISTRGVSSSTV